VISGEASSRELHAALSKGADSLLAKPIEMAELRKRVGSFVALAKHRRRRELRGPKEDKKTAAQRITTIFKGLRSRRKRRKFLGAVVGLMLAAMAGVAAVSVADLVFNAGHSIMGIIERFEGKLDRVEGYLERDEQRELQDRNRRR
jgi:hypothetical protein